MHTQLVLNEEYFTTSALDTTTAEHFAHTINALKGKVTMLVIAHGLPKCPKVDAIYRLTERRPANASGTSKTNKSNCNPSHIDRIFLWVVRILVFIPLPRAAIGRLDIIATAEGKLTPKTLLKIVQPVEAGLLKEKLV